MVVAAVRPPLERVEVVRVGLDDLAERRVAVTGRPRHDADGTGGHHPPDVRHGEERPEAAGLPDVDVLVVGDQADTAGLGRVAPTADHVAERDGESAPWLEPAPVHLSVGAAAELDDEPAAA